jgi:hypothetical protein
MIAFSASSYHFPVMGFMMVFAAYTVEKVLRREWRGLFFKRSFVMAAAIFLFIQIEYAYFIILLR